MATDALLVQGLTFLGVLAGVLYRTLYPYFQKVEEMEANGENPIKFLTKYKFSAVISLVIASATALGVVGNVQVPTDVNGIVNVGALFVAAFFVGYGANSVLNRASFKSSDSTTTKAFAQKKASEDKKPSER
jgi:TRAP-type C4-dicarboxylate transport system permease large subunit